MRLRLWERIKKTPIMIRRWSVYEERPTRGKTPKRARIGR
jgi:hypothetical protein